MAPKAPSATFDPAADLAAGKLYTVAVTSGVTDLAGNSLSPAFSSSFTSAASGSESITLTARGYKERGLQKAELQWTGATSVDIWRRTGSGSWVLITSEGTQPYIDEINAKGGGSYTYRVSSGDIFSNEAVVTF